MERDYENINPTTILNYILAVTVVVMLTVLVISIVEVTSAKKNCESLNGTYTLKNFNNFCDDKPFYKYSEGGWYWDKNFTKQINYSMLD